MAGSTPAETIPRAAAADSAWRLARAGAELMLAFAAKYKKSANRSEAIWFAGWSAYLAKKDGLARRAFEQLLEEHPMSELRPQVLHQRLRHPHREIVRQRERHHVLLALQHARRLRPDLHGPLVRTQNRPRRLFAQSFYIIEAQAHTPRALMLLNRAQPVRSGCSLAMIPLLA